MRILDLTGFLQTNRFPPRIKSGAGFRSKTLGTKARGSGARSAEPSRCLRLFGKAPLPDCFREGAVTGRAWASNLEVFGRGLAAIGNLFVFNRLPFVERGKASFLDRRNMDKHVLAATGGLDESKTLGRVEPLHSTFSHRVVSAGTKNKNGPPVPANRHVRRTHDTRYAGSLIA